MKTRIMVETTFTDIRTTVIYYPQYRWLFIWCCFRYFIPKMPDPDTTSFNTLEQAQLFLDAVLEAPKPKKSKSKSKSKYAYSYIMYP